MLSLKRLIPSNETFPKFVCSDCFKNIPVIKSLQVQNSSLFISYYCSCSSKEKTKLVEEFLSQLSKFKKRKISEDISQINSINLSKDNNCYEQNNNLPFSSIHEFEIKCETFIEKAKESFQNQINSLNNQIEKLQKAKNDLYDAFNNNIHINSLLIEMYLILYLSSLKTSQNETVNPTLDNLINLSDFNFKPYFPCSTNAEINSKSLLNYFKSSFILKLGFYHNLPSFNCIVKEGNISSFFQLKDGRIAYGLNDGTIQIFNLYSPSNTTTLKGHLEFVSGIVQLENEDIISGSGDCTIKIWDALNGICKKTYSEFTSQITSISSGKGKIIIGERNGTITILDSKVESILAKTQLNYSIKNILYLKNGNIAVVCFDQIYIFDSDLKKIKILEHEKKVYSILELKDGRIVSLSIDSLISVWNSDDYSLIRSIRDNNIKNIIQLNDGTVIGSTNEYLYKIYDMNTYQVISCVKSEISVNIQLQLKNGKLLSILEKNKILNF